MDSGLARWADRWPALLEPEQGGSGARMFLIHSPGELQQLLRDAPDLSQPDNLLRLQQYILVDPVRGIVRIEFLASANG